MSSIRDAKNAQAIAKQDEIKKAMYNDELVYFEGRPYYVQALRLPKSKLYGGAVYQAELVSADPSRWNSVIIVALEKVELEP